MQFHNQDESMASAHLPSVSWLLLAFVALSTLAHSLGLLLPTNHEVPQAEHRFGTTFISAVLSPAKDHPAAHDSHRPAHFPQAKDQSGEVSRFASITRTNQQSQPSSLSVTRNSEITKQPETISKTTSDTGSETSPNKKSKPPTTHSILKTPQQAEPFTTKMASTDDTAQPSSDQLASQLEEQRNYLLGELQNQLSRYLSYPLLARRRGWQGEVMVAFDINVIGQLNNIRLAHSSGYSVLDHSAVTAINKLQQISLPDTLGRLQAMELQLPVRYQLHEG